jgi:16S rRNA G966 N2-methylase RsmD
MKTNVLYYGDNLEILKNREYFPDACIDLIYLDPPFNSKKDYNILFKENGGVDSEAQIIVTFTKAQKIKSKEGEQMALE